VVRTERLTERRLPPGQAGPGKADQGVGDPIVHAIQVFEFIPRIADGFTVGNEVRVPPGLFQPMAAEDVAKAVGRVAVGKPLNGTIEVGGPEQFRFDEIIRRALTARSDARTVVAEADWGRNLGLRGGDLFVPSTRPARRPVFRPSSPTQRVRERSSCA
jgi:hypothetical protein